MICNLKTDVSPLTKRVNVLGAGVSAVAMDEAVAHLLDARRGGRRGYVCVTGAHGIMESQRDEELRRIHNRSLMTVPDGMPTVWMGHEQGFVKMSRVYGPDLMLEVCKQTAALNRLGSRGWELVGADTSNQKLGASTKHSTTEEMSFTHFLYGATEETLKKLKTNLEQRFPGIQIVGTYAPPFRPLNEDEEKELREIVAECKPDFFWVGLSTPKQEKFMASHCPSGCEHHEFQRTDAGGQMSEGRDDGKGADLGSPISDFCKFPLEAGIMLGVGAAFDIHAGNVKDTPKWIQNAGLQWLHRLCKEPRRLWRRYLWIVPGFLWLAALQLLGLKRFELEDKVAED